MFVKLLLLTFALWPLLAGAHDAGLSSATVYVSPSEILVQATYAPADLGALKGSSYADLASRSMELRARGLVIKTTSVEVREDGTDNVEFLLRFPRSSGETVLRSPLMSSLPYGHRQVITVRNLAGEPLLTELLNAGRDTISLSSVTSEGSIPLTRPRSLLPRGTTSAWVVALTIGAIWVIRRRLTGAREGAIVVNS